MAQPKASTAPVDTASALPKASAASAPEAVELSEAARSITLVRYLSDMEDVRFNALDCELSLTIVCRSFKKQSNFPAKTPVWTSQTMCARYHVFHSYPLMELQEPQSSLRVPQEPLEPIVIGSEEHQRMLRRFQKVKGVLRHIRCIMAETRRVSQQQADHLHRIDILIEHVILHFLDPDTM